MKFNEDPYNVFGWISFVKGHKSKITYFCFFLALQIWHRYTLVGAWKVSPKAAFA